MKAILIDASAFIHKAFHAMPRMVRPSDKQQIGAVNGFARTIWNMRTKGVWDDDMRQYIKPTHIACAWDKSRTNWRHVLFPEYKDNRGPMDPDLNVQLELCRKAADAMGIESLSFDNVEADDTIASTVKLIEGRGGLTIIVSSDKDFCQLVRDNTTLMWCPMAKRIIDEAAVVKRMKVPPSMCADLQALTGDSIDNIPGVPSIGPVTAQQLLEEFGDLETLLDRADDVKKAKPGQMLRLFKDRARLCRKLVSLRDDVGPIDVDNLAVKPLREDDVIGFLDEIESISLRDKIERDLIGVASFESEATCPVGLGP